MKKNKDKINLTRSLGIAEGQSEIPDNFDEIDISEDFEEDEMII